MSEYTPSRYNILVPLRNGRVLAYNSLSAATAVWERDEVAVFDDISESRSSDANEIISSLLYGGFIVSPGADELQTVREQYTAQRFDPRQMTLTIAPTLMCNFGCDYCFQGCDKPKGIMGLEVQDAILALVGKAAHSLARLSVAWYGGEPLLALSVVESLSERLIALCRERRLHYDAMIVTNGYGLTTEVATVLHGLRVGLAQVTLDGSKEYHDQRRRLLGGQSTFQHIVENLRAVVAGVPLRISVRINIDSRNRTSVHGLLDQLAELGFGHCQNFAVYFAPVEAVTEGCHAIANLCMSKSEYGELETELTRYAFDRGLTSLPYPPRFRGLCAAVRPKGWVIAPNGDLHKCWDTISLANGKVGSVFDLESLKTDERAAKWLEWTPFGNETCLNCRILPNCAGSCAHKFINPEQTRGEGASLPCPSWKYNIKERLVLMAEQRGAITCEDYDPDAIRTEPSELCVMSRATLRHVDPIGVCA